MSKMIHTLLSVAISSLLLASSTQALADKHQEKQATKSAPEVEKHQDSNETVNLGSYFCKDVMRLRGDERDIALGFMHGYYLGKKGVTEYQAGMLGKASDEFMEYCLDHPNDKALESMGKFLK